MLCSLLSKSTMEIADDDVDEELYMSMVQERVTVDENIMMQSEEDIIQQFAMTRRLAPPRATSCWQR